MLVHGAARGSVSGVADGAARRESRRALATTAAAGYFSRRTRRRTRVDVETAMKGKNR